MLQKPTEAREKMLGLRNRDKENGGNEEEEHISWLGVVDSVSSRTEMTSREKKRLQTQLSYSSLYKIISKIEDQFSTYTKNRRRRMILQQCFTPYFTEHKMLNLTSCASRITAMR